MKVWPPPSHFTGTAPLESTVPTARDAVRALYVAHARELYVTLKRLTWPGCDVDALLHDVFVVAIRRADVLQAATSAKGWLFGVALSLAAAAGRKHRLRALLGLSVPRATQVADPSIAHEHADTVERALAGLSAKKREVLVLFELQGWSGPDIAQALGCSEQTVWSRLHYARREFEAAVRRG